MYEIEKDYVIFREIPTKKELDNLPLTKVCYRCDKELDENFKNSNIIDLQFGYYFNQSVDNLPAKLTVLKFGYEFNQPVDNLPQTLINLTFGENFNQSINNLPLNLKYLNIGNNFNQSLDFLPNNIKYLSIFKCFCYSHDLLNLPNSLKKLLIMKEYKGNINVPSNRVVEKIE